MTGSTPGIYINRTGRYEVDLKGAIWLVGGPDLPCGKKRVRIDKLPPDAAAASAAMRAGSSGGATPAGQGPEQQALESESAD